MIDGCDRSWYRLYCILFNLNVITFLRSFTAISYRLFGLISSGAIPATYLVLLSSEHQSISSRGSGKSICVCLRTGENDRQSLSIHVV
jgi:hypothetical protein